MKIAYLTQILPYPLDAGPKVRAYYTLRHLAARHSVSLISLVRPSDADAHIAHLREVCDQVVTVPIARSRLRDGLALGRSLLADEPFLITRDRVTRLHQAIAATMSGASFDAVHADQLWMAPYALAARHRARQAGRRMPIVLDQHNAVYLVPRRLSESAGNPVTRWSFAAESRRLARFEARVCRDFDKVVTVTHEDGQALQTLYSNGSRPEAFPVIPICIDPGPAPAFDRPRGEPAMFFLGGMHWPSNYDGALWFFRDVLPRVWRSQPEARLLVVGRQPPAELHRAGARVEAPGFVPDVRGYWNRSRAFVVPLRSGAGMRVKILDAWARGVPVVSTRIGAEGLACHPGEDILIADTPEDFAQATLKVLTDCALAERLARNGRRTVERCYDWRQVYPAWDEVYTSIAG
jgi:glycosyltransferase involved in cell wall biosynthesis